MGPTPRNDPGRPDPGDPAVLALLAASLALATASTPALAPPAAGGHLADIGPAPEVRLVDASGRPFDLADLRGRAVLVSFIYTTCTGTCPATTAAMVRIRRHLGRAGLGGDRVAFVSITLDPANDTPEVLRRYARQQGADGPDWWFLSGEPGRVAGVVAAWDMWARVGPSGALDHPSRVFLLDPAGRRREIYSLEFLRPEAVLRDVRSLLPEDEDRRP